MATRCSSPLRAAAAATVARSQVLQNDQILTRISARQKNYNVKSLTSKDKKKPHSSADQYCFTGEAPEAAASFRENNAPFLLTRRPATMQVGDEIVMLVIADGMVLYRVHHWEKSTLLLFLVFISKLLKNCLCHFSRVLK
jgi:hypothetical protein